MGTVKNENYNKKVKLLASLNFYTNIFGFFSVVIVSSLTFGLSIGWQAINEGNKFFPEGYNLFREMSGRYFIISICFFLLLFRRYFSGKGKSTFLFFIPTLIIVLQSYILTFSSPSSLPNWIVNYSSKLNFIIYLGYFYFILGLFTLTLQIWTLWILNKSKTNIM